MSLISFPTFALDSLNVEMTGIVKGFVDQGWDVEINDTHIFLATGTTGLKILDRSNLDDLQWVGESLRKLSDRPGGDFWLDKVRYHNGYLYGLYFDGTMDFSNYNLTIFDISDPSNPFELGSVFVQDLTTDLCFHGDLVFASSTQIHPVHQQYGITVVDVSDPSNPTEVGFVNTGNRMQNSVDVSGDTLFYSSFGMTPLVVGAVDISDLSATTEISTWESPSNEPYFGDILVDGSNLYLLDYNFGLRVLDISNPAEMSLIGSMDLGCSYPTHIFSTLTMSDSNLEYLKVGRMSNEFGETGIIDISDPTSPQQGVTYTVNEPIGGIGCLDKEFCFFTMESYLPVAINRVDLTSSANPVHTEYPIFNSPWSIASQVNVVYVGTSEGDVIIMDISNPSEVTISGTIEDYQSHHVKHMTTRDDKLFIPFDSEMGGGVEVFDVSQPLNPTSIATVSDPAMMMGPSHIDMDDNYIVMACGYDGIWLFDISGTVPVVCDNWNPNDQIPEYAVSYVGMNYPYVYAVTNTQIFVLDISAPANITQNGVSVIQGRITSLEVSPSGQYMVTSEGPEGAKIYDLSDPTSPVILTDMGDEIENAMNAVIDGDQVFVTDYGQIGVHVYDVTDLENPVRTGYHETRGSFPWKISATQNGFAIANIECVEFFEMMTNSVEEEIVRIPDTFNVTSIYPNPFNPSTTIKVEVHKDIFTTIYVYNVLGQSVAELFNGRLTAGNHNFQFNASTLPSGDYFISINGGDSGQKISRVTLLK